MQKVEHNLSREEPMTKEQVIDFINRAYTWKHTEGDLSKEVTFKDVVYDVIL